jgi:hypothetical protein
MEVVNNGGQEFHSLSDAKSNLNSAIDRVPHRLSQESTILLQVPLSKSLIRVM